MKENMLYSKNLKNPVKTRVNEEEENGLGRGQTMEITVTFLRSLNFFKYKRKPKTGLKQGKEPDQTALQINIHLASEKRRMLTEQN